MLKQLILLLILPLSMPVLGNDIDSDLEVIIQSENFEFLLPAEAMSQRLEKMLNGLQREEMGVSAVVSNSNFLFEKDKLLVSGTVTLNGRLSLGGWPAKSFDNQKLGFKGYVHISADNWEVSTNVSDLKIDTDDQQIKIYLIVKYGRNGLDSFIKTEVDKYLDKLLSGKNFKELWYERASVFGEIFGFSDIPRIPKHSELRIRTRPEGFSIGVHFSQQDISDLP